MADPGDILTEVRFWAQVMTDAQRTVLCPPEWESRCKGYVDARGLGGLIKVVASPIVPPNQIVVVDENALEASNRQALQAWKPVWADGGDMWFRTKWSLGLYPLTCQPRPEPADYLLERWEDDGGSC